MTAFLLVLIPLLSMPVAFVLPIRQRRILPLATAVINLVLIIQAPKAISGSNTSWLVIDATGYLFMILTALLFLAASVSLLPYLKTHAAPGQSGSFLPTRLRPSRETVFIANLLFFLASMNMVCVSNNFGLLWIAIEMTTLSSAPLVYFHKSASSLEATWKYLLTCSIGIALALLGNFFLASSMPYSANHELSLFFSDVLSQAGSLNHSWLAAAMICFVVGYGTKMGLAPMHSWLPDAHSESPALVSALMSGALLNCAWLGILRGYAVCVAAGQQSFVAHLFIGFGLFSMLFAAAFIVGQRDYKRLLAYSSVENMGIIALATGLGGGYVAMLHTVYHSLTKGMLFLTSGRILEHTGTKKTASVRGLIISSPLTGLLWLLGIIAITGAPPFGPFFSEFMIFNLGLQAGHYWITAAYAVLLTTIFAGFFAVGLPMVQGEPLSKSLKPVSLISALPPLILLISVAILGVWLPAPIKQSIEAAARQVGIL